MARGRWRCRPTLMLGFLCLYRLQRVQHDETMAIHPLDETLFGTGCRPYSYVLPDFGVIGCRVQHDETLFRTGRRFVRGCRTMSAEPALAAA